MAQETFEEVAERLYPIIETNDYMDWYDKNYDIRNSFIEGYKWQQEKICSSEVIQRIRASKSDAEAIRIIKTI
jgi:hypothetical protein